MSDETQQFRKDFTNFAKAYDDSSDNVLNIYDFFKHDIFIKQSEFTIENRLNREEDGEEDGQEGSIQFLMQVLEYVCPNYHMKTDYRVDMPFEGYYKKQLPKNLLFSVIRIEPLHEHRIQKSKTLNRSEENNIWEIGCHYFYVPPYISSALFLRTIRINDNDGKHLLDSLETALNTQQHDIDKFIIAHYYGQLLDDDYQPLSLHPDHLSVNVNGTQYDLCAIICHITAEGDGQRDGGHYVTYKKVDDSWFLLDDSNNPKKLNFKDVVKHLSNEELPQHVTSMLLVKNGHRTNTKLRKLLNETNCCYMNSTLQLLLCINELRDISPPPEQVINKFAEKEEYEQDYKDVKYYKQYLDSELFAAEVVYQDLLQTRMLELKHKKKCAKTDNELKQILIINDLDVDKTLQYVV